MGFYKYTNKAGGIDTEIFIEMTDVSILERFVHNTQEEGESTAIITFKSGYQLTLRFGNVGDSDSFFNEFLRQNDAVAESLK